MATEAPVKGFGATLGKKVGPLPLGVWLAAGLGVWWYMQKKNSASGKPGATTSQTGYGTDPAGNTGYIDPSTGYVYGSAEDIAALQSQGLVGANSYNTGGGGDTSGTGAAGSTVTDSGSGSPSPGGTTATGSAGSPSSTGTSQGGSTTGQTNQSGTSVTTPGAPGTGSGKTSTPGAPQPSNNWRYPAPGGLSSNSISDSGFRLSWSAVQGPNGQKPSSYAVAIWLSNKKVSQHNVTVTNSIEYGPGGTGLKPATTYRAQVWANGGPLAPPGSIIAVTTKAKGQA